MRFRRTAGLLATVAAGAAVAAGTVSAGGAPLTGRSPQTARHTRAVRDCGRRGVPEEEPQHTRHRWHRRYGRWLHAVLQGRDRHLERVAQDQPGPRARRRPVATTASVHRLRGGQRRHLHRRQPGEHVGDVPDHGGAQEDLGARLEGLNWNDIRSSFPNQSLRLFGPGTDSGTFDFFTEHVNGRARASRTDYQASEDDNVLVQGVRASGGMGYSGLSYASTTRQAQHRRMDKGNGCVSRTTNGPEPLVPDLPRPLMYVKKHRSHGPSCRVRRLHPRNEKAIALKSKYVPLTPTQLKTPSASSSTRSERQEG